MLGGRRPPNLRRWAGSPNCIWVSPMVVLNWPFPQKVVYHFRSAPTANCKPIPRWFSFVVGSSLVYLCCFVLVGRVYHLLGSKALVHKQHPCKDLSHLLRVKRLPFTFGFDNMETGSLLDMFFDYIIRSTFIMCGYCMVI